jgi:hypothetical protein
MKPVLKAPETKRLRLKYDEQLSNPAFNCNLRHYTLDAAGAATAIGYHCFRGVITPVGPFTHSRIPFPAQLEPFCP